MRKIFLSLLVIIMGLLLIPSCTFYETEGAYVPVNTVPDYYTMRVYDDRYVFYSGVEPVAVWRFGADGVYIKEGIVINGPVRVYSEPGVLFAETYYSNGIRDGACRYYYPSGAVMYSGYYRAGYLSGSWSSYNVHGGVMASYQFHGTETAMPSNFQPPQNQNARLGFQAMQKETAYTGTQPVVSQSFNKVQAVPTNYTRSFGVPPPVQPANANGYGMHQGNGPGSGTGQAQGLGQGKQPVNAPGQQPGLGQKAGIGQVPQPGNAPVQQPGMGQQPGMVQGQQPGMGANQYKNNKAGGKFAKFNKKQKPGPGMPFNKPKPAKKKGKKKNDKMF